MPRKAPETIEERRSRNQYQRNLHHTKIDYIAKIRDLLLPESQHGMETRDTLRAIRRVMEDRRPQWVGRDTQHVFRRTIEIDGVRKSVWVSSKFDENTQLFKERAQFDARRVLGVKKEENYTTAINDAIPAVEMEETRAKPTTFSRLFRNHHQVKNQKRTTYPVRTVQRNGMNDGGPLQNRQRKWWYGKFSGPNNDTESVIDLPMPTMNADAWVFPVPEPQPSRSIVVEEPNCFRWLLDIDEAAKRYKERYAWTPPCDVTKYNDFFKI